RDRRLLIEGGDLDDELHMSLLGGVVCPWSIAGGHERGAVRAGRRTVYCPVGTRVTNAARLNRNPATRRNRGVSGRGARRHVGRASTSGGSKARALQSPPAMNLATDFDSTLIRHGLQATTITEMTRFVSLMEERPLDKLLSELPGFALLSETKFSLARAVLRRRARQ